MKKMSLNPRLVAISAVMTAVVFVLTRMIQVPTPARGYVHLGDAGIFFAALAFGPWVGGIAGALGTGLSDLTSGYAQWAIFSFLVHGLQGILVGLIFRRSAKSKTRAVNWGALLASVLVGGATVVAGYFVAGVILMGTGAAVAEIPANLIQALSGGIIGAPLFLAVRQAYPPLNQG